MPIVNLSRPTITKLTVVFPTHKARHDVGPGPVTIITFGSTITDNLVHPVSIELPEERSIIDIYDAENRLVCSWEANGIINKAGTDSPLVNSHVTLKQEKKDDSDPAELEVLYSRKVKHGVPDLPRLPMTPESSSRLTPLAFTTPEQPQLSIAGSTTRDIGLSESSDHTPITPSTTRGPRTITPTRRQEATIRSGNPPSKARRTLGGKAPTPKSIRQALRGSTSHPKSTSSRQGTNPSTPSVPQPALPRSPRPAIIPHTDTPLTDIQRQYLRKVITSLKKHSRAIEFLQPVNHVLNPTYPTIITEPIDLSTITNKLKPKDNNTYTTLHALRSDFEHMVRNAEIFNGPDHDVTHDAHVLKQQLEGYLARFPGPEVESSEAVRLLFGMGPQFEYERGRESTVAPQVVGGRCMHPRGIKRRVDYSVEDYFAKKRLG